MRIFSRFLLSAAAGMLAVVCRAAGEMEIAREALRDGLWETARRHAAKVDGEDARRLVLESYAREGDWQGMAATLASWTNAVGGVYDYYRAASAGDYFRAFKLLQQSGAAAGDADSKMFAADMLLKSGRRPEAEKLWREVVSMTNTSSRAYAVAGVNLGDEEALRLAFANASRASVRRLAGLGLGRLLLKDGKRRADGEKLVRSIVKDAPDVEGAMDAFIAIAEAEIAAGRWREAFDVYQESVETWPESAKLVQVQEGRAWACLKLGRLEEALEAFKRAEALAADGERKATAVLKQGDVYSEMGKGEMAMERYREVLGAYPDTAVAGRLRKVVKIRELESKGRELYKSFRFAEAKAVFAEIAAADPAKKARMDFFEALCLYGQGLDDAAVAKAREVAQSASEPSVRVEATLWTAKFLFNRGEWKESGELFRAYAAMEPGGASLPDALVWAARAAFSAGDFNGAIQTASDLARLRPDSPQTVQALTVQGEALIELTRFDEAVLVLERAAHSETAPARDRIRARLLKADALFATGADNPARYLAALETYRSVLFGGTLDASAGICVSFKIAKVLEKLKRTEEAVDQYYSQVVLAYRRYRRDGVRLDDDARAAFSRAAFRLADEFESRGRDYQAIHILELVAASDVPASGEAEKRIGRITMKGGFP